MKDNSRTREGEEHNVFSVLKDFYEFEKSQVLSNFGKVDTPAYKGTTVHPNPDFPPAHLNHSTLVFTVVCFQSSLIE